MKGFGISRLVFSLDEMDRKKNTFVPGTKPERTKSILKPFFFPDFSLESRQRYDISCS